MKKSFLFLSVLAGISAGTFGQIININGEFSNIQAGIDSASTGDTVLVAEGTYYENINFRGKAITVASQFILDRDTAYISKTIIDGSQASSPDTASVVTMWSGEDTTSVLVGFTITGGRGTAFLNAQNNPRRGGGGIFILGSGGKIVHNIIEWNRLEKANGTGKHFGGGIYARVTNFHSAVIRENIIRSNTIVGTNAGGGGVLAYGGRIVCEYNKIINNTAIATDWVYGGGMMGEYGDAEGVIREVIVRNNVISGNLADTKNDGAGGGGYFQFHGYGVEHTRVYNNLISDNHSTYIGGGAIFWGQAKSSVFNNSIVDNTAVESGANVVFVYGAEVSLYNNIIWSVGNSKIPEFALYEVDAAKPTAFNNLIKKPFKPGDPIIAYNNWFNKPAFQPGSYKLAESSPGIGWALDSVLMDTSWNYAPLMDLDGNPRPHPIDSYIDLGAYESEFERTDTTSIAYLTEIRLWDRMLEPSFHRDTLNYLLSVPDTVTIVPELDAIPLFQGASLELNSATDLQSTDPPDRTTIITVTSEDGSTQKVYKVTFYLKATDATLSELSISQGELDPAFESGTTYYRVCLPYRSTETPSVSAAPTHPKATMEIIPAEDITNQHKDITSIIVTPEDGVKLQKKYYVEFNPDPNFPRLSLVSDTVNRPDTIEVKSNRNGYIFLLQNETDKILDSLIANMIDSTAVNMNEMIYLPTVSLDKGLYWLYAVNQCNSVSDPVIVLVTGISFLQLASNQLYPNPIEDVVYIDLDQSISTVRLFDIIGAELMTLYNPDKRISLSHLKKGTYIIRIETINGEFYTGKLIKH